MYTLHLREKLETDGQIKTILWTVRARKESIKVKKKDANSRLVYSTESGRICPSWGKQAAKCIRKNKKTETSPGGDGKTRVERSTKGRKGKGVTLITGLPLEHNSLKALSKTLKQKCGG